MKFADNLRNKFLMPEQTVGDSAFRVAAVVIESDEKGNVCTVKYRNKKGILVTKENAVVRSSSPSIIDWFPERGDYVMIEVYGGKPTVTGMLDGEARTKSKADSTLDNDVYSDNMGCETNGGYIY